MHTPTRCRHLVLPFALALAAALPLAVQAQSASPLAADAAALEQAPLPLKPGEYEWHPERTGAGQLVLVVSLPTQQVHVYRNGVRIGVSTISSGKPGKETPTGTFEILQKKQMHHSNLYDNAPMPYMQRLTWDGIALHAGRLPGYPASHGCIRLPKAFAKLLFEETRKGMLVVVADASSHGPEVVYPGERAPVDAYSGMPLVAVDAIAARVPTEDRDSAGALAALPD